MDRFTFPGFCRFVLALLLLVSLIPGSLISGCTKYQEHFESSDSDYGSRTKEKGNPPPGARMYGPTTDNGSVHHNRGLKMSQKAMNEINKMDGIYDNIVMLTDRNAYVAVSLADSATGTYGKGGQPKPNNAGTQEGVYDTDFGNGSPIVRWNMTITGANSPRTVPYPQELSSELKQAIAEKVRKIHPYVLEVYVSANRDFTNWMYELAEVQWRGESLSPYVQKFNQVVRAHFDPNNRPNPAGHPPARQERQH